MWEFGGVGGGSSIIIYEKYHTAGLSFLAKEERVV